MENGPLVVSANFCNPLDGRALSKNVFPLFRLCPTASHIHPDFPLLFHLMDTSAFIGSNLPTRRHYFRFARHPLAIGGSHNCSSLHNNTLEHSGEASRCYATLIRVQSFGHNFEK